MSFSAARESQSKHQCQSCQERKARFRFRGVVKADRDHTLCFECFRSARDRRRAQALKNIPPPRPISRPFDVEPPLTERSRAHRQRMLAWLEATTA
jgi:hypothetical protein